MAAKFHSFFLGLTYSVLCILSNILRADFKAALAKTTVGAAAAGEGEL